MKWALRHFMMKRCAKESEWAGPDLGSQLSRIHPEPCHKQVQIRFVHCVSHTGQEYDDNNMIATEPV